MDVSKKGDKFSKLTRVDLFAKKSVNFLLLLTSMQEKLT